MMSESLITKETSLPDIRLENNDFEKIRVGPYATNTKLILVDLVEDDEDSGPQTSDLQLTMRSK
jgi:hypothetical protein